jgi:hypothetical protein
MCDIQIRLGRYWEDTPQTWRSFVESLPTYGTGNTPAHTQCLAAALETYDAHMSSDDNQGLTVTFTNSEGYTAWCLPYG